MKYISQGECPKNTWKSFFEVNILTVTLLCTCFHVFYPSVWVVFTKLPFLFCRTMASEKVCPKLLKTKSYHNSDQPYCLGFTQIFSWLKRFVSSLTYILKHVSKKSWISQEKWKPLLIKCQKIWTKTAFSICRMFPLSCFREYKSLINQVKENCKPGKWPKGPDFKEFF